MISSKSTASSNFLETKETIGSTLRFWIISKVFRQCFRQFQDSAQASQSLKDFIKLIKEHDRKIRIAYSPESSWPKAKHYENNAVALDLEDDKRIRIAEREALRAKTGTHAKRHNAARMQSRHLPFTQSYSIRRQSKWPVRFINRFQATNSNPGIPVIIANEALAGSVAPIVICRESVPSGWALPEPSPSKMLFNICCRNKFQHVYYTLMHRRSSLVNCLQVFQNYWVPTKELFPPSLNLI